MRKGQVDIHCIIILFLCEYLTQAHLVNDGIVVSAAFIVHTPPSIHKLKLFIFDKSFHLGNKKGGGGG